MVYFFGFGSRGKVAGEVFRVLSECRGRRRGDLYLGMFFYFTCKDVSLVVYLYGCRFLFCICFVGGRRREGL